MSIALKWFCEILNLCFYLLCNTLTIRMSDTKTKNNRTNGVTDEVASTVDEMFVRVGCQNRLNTELAKPRNLFHII